MWLKRYHAALAKTAHGGQSLYDHTFQCVDAGLRIAKLFPDYPSEKLDMLLFSLCIHDVGKLDPAFQALLNAKVRGTALPKRKVKHEGRTFANDHVALVESNIHEITKELAAVTGYVIDIERLLANEVVWAWGYAVAHHGWYYISYERDEAGASQPHARRQWTRFNPLEESRLTLVDLLIHFHPLGGMVMMADLMASYAYETQRDLATLFDDVDSLSAVFNKLIAHAEQLETALQGDDKRDYQLRELLTLLAGGALKEELQ